MKLKKKLSKKNIVILYKYMSSDSSPYEIKKNNIITSIKNLKKKKIECESNLEQLKKELQDKTTQIGSIEADKKQKEEDIDRIQEELKNSSALTESQKQTIASVQESVDKAENELKIAKEKALEVETELNKSKEFAREIEAKSVEAIELEKIKAEVEKKEALESQSEQLVLEAEEKLKQAEKKSSESLELLRKELTETNNLEAAKKVEELSNKETALTELKNSLDESNSEIDKLKKYIDEIEAEINKSNPKEIYLDILKNYPDKQDLTTSFYTRLTNTTLLPDAEKIKQEIIVLQEPKHKSDIMKLFNKFVDNNNSLESLRIADSELNISVGGKPKKNKNKSKKLKIIKKTKKYTTKRRNKSFRRSKK